MSVLGGKAEDIYSSGAFPVLTRHRDWNRDHDHDLLPIVIVSFDVSVSFHFRFWGLSDASLAGRSPYGLADPAG